MLLDGVRVLDFTWVGAGPLTTKVLADFGADVIKIESRSRPDPLRSTPPFKDGQPGLERSGYFANRNASKRSFALDMSHPKAREIALRLAAVSDICAQSFRPGTMEHWGLGYDDLVTVRPDIIYLGMPMQGESGPHAGYSGFGATLVALSGLYWLCGSPARPPVGTGTNYPDHVPNPMHAAFAVLLALRDRRRTGRGCRIELSQLESTLNVLGSALLRTLDGDQPRRMGNSLPHAAPHGVYPAAGQDEWVVVGVFDDAQWRAAAAVTGIERWRADASLRRVAARLDQRDQLDAEMSSWTLMRTAAAAAEALQHAGVPAGVLARSPEVITNPQLEHRGAFRWLDHPEIGRSLYTAPTPKLSRTPGALRGPAPLLGQHTRDICRTLLAMSDEEIDALAAEGVVA
jgi:benzylsuccinate CoA-transferase BbsF subunit